MLPNNETPRVASSLVQLYKPLTSGVILSPLVSFTALTPILARVPDESKGFTVSILIVAPIPPVPTFARPVLYTCRPLTPSDAKFEKSNERLVPEAP